MANAYILEFDGATAEQYDSVLDDMQLGGRLPAGALYHAAGPTASGWMVCDVWESAEAFGEFAETKIGPFSAKHGLGEPRIRSFEVTEIREGTPGDVGVMQVVTIAGVDAAAFVELDKAVVGPEREVPEGCIYHVNGPLGDDWVVLDYWTSLEIRDAFVENQVAPAMQAAGRTEPPAIETVVVHNALTEALA